MPDREARPGALTHERQLRASTRLVRTPARLTRGTTPVTLLRAVPVERRQGLHRGAPAALLQAHRGQLPGRLTGRGQSQVVAAQALETLADRLGSRDDRQRLSGQGGGLTGGSGGLTGVPVPSYQVQQGQDQGGVRPGAQAGQQLPQRGLDAGQGVVADERPLINSE